VGKKRLRLAYRRSGRSLFVCAESVVKQSESQQAFNISVATSHKWRKILSSVLEGVRR